VIHIKAKNGFVDCGTVRRIGDGCDVGIERIERAIMVTLLVKAAALQQTLYARLGQFLPFSWF